MHTLIIPTRTIDTSIEAVMLRAWLWRKSQNFEYGLRWAA
jgi:hypothetical protein